jgi:hypothetical protein
MYTIDQILIQRKDGLEINGHQIELQLVIVGISTKSHKMLAVVIPIYSFNNSSYSNNFFRDIVNVAKKPLSNKATLNVKEIIPKAPYYRYSDGIEYVIFREMDGLSMNSEEYDQFFDPGNNVDVGLVKSIRTATVISEAPNRGKRTGEDEVSLKYNEKGTSGLRQTYSKNMTCKPVFSSDGSPIKVNEDTAPKTSPFIDYIVDVFGGGDSDDTRDGFTLILYYFLGAIIALIFFIAILFLFKMIIDKMVKVNITTE